MKTICKTLTLLVLVVILITGNPLYADEIRERKAIVLVMDYIDVTDLINAKTPHLDKLTEISGTGLINIRSRSKLPSSSYLSLAAGNRVGIIPNAEYSFNSNELVPELPNIFKSENSNLQGAELYSLFTGKTAPPEGVVNLYSEPLSKYASKYNPAFQIGQLGTLAHDIGLKVAVLGNSDTINSIDRSIVLLAMNQNGVVDCGDVSYNLLEKDSRSLGGVRSNHQVMADKFASLLKYSDILLVDMGDTTRIEKSRENCSDDILQEHRKNALERNDKLLGEIISNINMKQTMLVILSPNPNKDMVLQGNFGLTPIIIYNPDNPRGLLTSSTTRRIGLVNSTDFLPDLLSFFTPDSNSPLSGIESRLLDNSLKKLEQDINFFIQLRQSRNPLHYYFMLFAFLTITAIFLLIYQKKDNLGYFLKILLYSTLSIPIIFLFLSYTGYTSIFGTIAIALSASLCAGILAEKFFNNPVNALLFLTGTAALLIITDCLRGSPLMLASPMGSDAIAGGRFYGIGNDYMGVLLASTVISTVLLLGKFRLRPVARTAAGLLPLALVCVTIGHPGYGANVGGLITAMVTLGIFLTISLERKFRFKQLLMIGSIAFFGVVTVALLDGLLSSNPSHAGKTIILLINGEPLFFLSIIKTKLGILGSTIYNSRWSLILLLSIIVILILAWHNRQNLTQIQQEYRELYQIAAILLSTMATVFVVNDTGVIASALVSLYLIASLGILGTSSGE